MSSVGIVGASLCSALMFDQEAVVSNNHVAISRGANASLLIRTSMLRAVGSGFASAMRAGIATRAGMAVVGLPQVAVRSGASFGVAARWLNASRCVADEPVTETKRTERTMQRFWKEVYLRHVEPSDAEECFEIQLDKRSLRTPSGAVLRVPGDRPLLACLIAQEWDEQSQIVKPHSLPLTSLVARAIDGLLTYEERVEVAEYLLRYFDTDAVCFHESDPKMLVQLQHERWDPLVAWAEQYFQMKINVARDSLHLEQPAESRQRIGALLRNMEPLDLAATERAVITTKSMVIGLALAHRHLEAEQAALAAEVETASQASSWGAVEDSHDVDHAELRRQLASVACAQVTTEPELVSRFAEVVRRRGGKLCVAN